MKKIIIFAGTTEGRTLSEGLAAAGIAHTVCVATDYGELVMHPDSLVEIRTGRMEKTEMETFFADGVEVVYDATHPYAKIVTENIKAACEKNGVNYVRVLRSDAAENKKQVKTELAADGDFDVSAEAQTPDVISEGDAITYFDTTEACAQALAKTAGNILLTTGSKELAAYASKEGVKERLFARVLPSEESIQLCHNAGIFGKQILAMHGPFSADLNEALIRQFSIQCLVTKQSGITGGYYEKLQAAMACGISVFVIGKPKEEQGVTVEEVLKSYGAVLPIEITLIGTGPGAKELLTLQAKTAIDQADVVFGAKRLIEDIAGKEVYPYYLAKDVIPVLSEGRSKRSVMLFSGDSGFFSGTEKMKAELERWAEEKKIPCAIRVYPGISSLSYLAAKAGEAYQEAPFISLHGKSGDPAILHRLIGKVCANSKVFLILSGAADVQLLGKTLLANGLDHCEVILGYELSYPQEELQILSPAECLHVEKAGLYAAIIKNPLPNRDGSHTSSEQAGQSVQITNDPSAIRKQSERMWYDNCGRAIEGERLIPVLDDDAFDRVLNEKTTVPMTKEMIRHASLIRLDLCPGAVLYDVGSGTGSVSVEAALLDPSIKVYAIERKEAAVELTGKNSRKFGCSNVQVISGLAPDAFKNLEAPTHVFIGGSGGNLQEILFSVKKKNPHARIVINAVSLETIAEVTDLLKTMEVKNLKIEQLSVSRGRKLGSYHLLNADNPVMIVSFTLR